MRLSFTRRRGNMGIYGGFGSKPAAPVFQPPVGTSGDDGSEDAKRGGPVEPSVKKRRWWRHRKTKRESASALAANGLIAMTIGLVVLWLADAAAGRAIESGSTRDAGSWYFLMLIGGLMALWGARQLVSAWRRWRHAIRQRPLEGDTFD